MNVSVKWLGNYFKKPLPPVEDICHGLTFHAFEVESYNEDVIDIDILPNRAADCLSHRGIAREISAILDISIATDSLREELPKLPASKTLSVTVEDSKKCPRYMGVVVRGVRIAPSPAWLREALESVGQRSINNIVDATNYVMLNIGQPLHAFDVAKLEKKNGMYSVAVRGAHAGEEFTALGGEKYLLDEGALIIADNNSGTSLAVAGVKGGVAAEVTSETTDIIVEAANFDGPLVRRSAHRLKLFTDASIRFQNGLSAELPAYGMRDVLTLITDIAGGEVEGVADVYPTQQQSVPTVAASVSVTLAKINGVLGIALTTQDVAEVFTKLGFSMSIDGETFTVVPPFERVDIKLPEDLIEEVGRIIGYDIIPEEPLPPIEDAPDTACFCGIERIKDYFVEHDFTEISTQVFVKKGDITLANPLDKTRPALRTSLVQNMEQALERARQYAPRVLPPRATPKLFEIGSVFTAQGEYLSLAYTGEINDDGVLSGILSNAKTIAGIFEVMLEDDAVVSFGRGYTPKKYILDTYVSFSIYPFALRDIAVWTPEGTTSGNASSVIKAHAGDLLVRVDQFDSYSKDGRVSYAFRLVFEAPDHTLTDEEVNKFMENITTELNKNEGYKVR